MDGFTSASGALLTRASYQPFGAHRSGNWVGSTPTAAEWQQIQRTTPRGYTGHEHLNNLGVIHMNGRLYDPVLGRFLSPDPVVQAPHDTQGFNRYAYVRNNPLRYTDPSGFCYQTPPDSKGESQCIEEVFARTAMTISEWSWTQGVRSGLPQAWDSIADLLDDWKYDDDLGWLIGGGLALLEPGPLGEMLLASAAIGPTDGRRLMQFCTVAQPRTAFRDCCRELPRVARTPRSRMRKWCAYTGCTEGRSGQIGSYWSTTAPTGVLRSRIELALNPRWGNSANQVVAIDVPAGVKMYEGIAASQGGLVGGGTQVFVPSVNPAWIVP